MGWPTIYDRMDGVAEADIDAARAFFSLMEPPPGVEFVPGRIGPRAFEVAAYTRDAAGVPFGASQVIPMAMVRDAAQPMFPIVTAAELARALRRAIDEHAEGPVTSP